MSTIKALGGSFAAIIVMIVAQVFASLLASFLIMANMPMWVGNIVAGFLYLSIAYFLLKLLVIKLLKFEMKDMGMPRFALRPRYLAIAIVLPVAVTAFYLLFAGGEYVSSNLDVAQMLPILSAGIFFTGMGAGFVEEMVFRGVILHLLKGRWNTVVGVAVPSLLFGIVHVLGMGFSVGSCVLVILAGTAVGIMFSLIAIESNSVWNSGIVHCLWNMIIIGGGLTISSTLSEDSVLTYVLYSKSFILTGGEFGIESSLIALLGYVAVAVSVLIAMRRGRRLRKAIDK